MPQAFLPVGLLLLCALGLAMGLLAAAGLLNHGRPNRVSRMPYESGMDPIHDTRRRFDVRFYLLAIAFLIFDVELLFLYPWAVVAKAESGERRAETVLTIHPKVVDSESDRLSHPVTASTSTLRLPPSALRFAFPGAMVFLALLTVGYVYEWRKGAFRWK